MDFLELRSRIMSEGVAFRTRQQIWHYCMSLVEPGDSCLEFGVWYGTSINWMANTRPDSHFHGFDCFEGLPEDWIKGHPKGHFKVDRARLKWAPNIIIHDGLFEHTLEGFRPERVKLIHIDCDLGSSCDTVLSKLESVILEQKPLLLFDEFYSYVGYEDHEFMSFLKFINSTNASFRVIGRNINHQQVLLQTL